MAKPRKKGRNDALGFEVVEKMTEPPKAPKDADQGRLLFQDDSVAAGVAAPPVPPTVKAGPGPSKAKEMGVLFGIGLVLVSILIALGVFRPNVSTPEPTESTEVVKAEVTAYLSKQAEEYEPAETPAPAVHERVGGLGAEREAALKAERVRREAEVLPAPAPEAVPESPPVVEETAEAVAVPAVEPVDPSVADGPQMPEQIRESVEAVRTAEETLRREEVRRAAARVVEETPAVDQVSYMRFQAKFDALMQRGRVAEAMAMANDCLGDDRFAAAATAIERDREDVERILAVRRAALNALAKRQGQPYRFRDRSGLRFTGTVESVAETVIVLQTGVGADVRQKVRLAPSDLSHDTVMALASETIDVRKAEGALTMGCYCLHAGKRARAMALFSRARLLGLDTARYDRKLR